MAGSKAASSEDLRQMNIISSLIHNMAPLGLFVAYRLSAVCRSLVPLCYTRACISSVRRSIEGEME